MRTSRERGLLVGPLVLDCRRPRRQGATVFRLVRRGCRPLTGRVRQGDGVRRAAEATSAFARNGRKSFIINTQAKTRLRRWVYCSAEKTRATVGIRPTILMCFTLAIAAWSLERGLSGPCRAQQLRRQSRQRSRVVGKIRVLHRKRQGVDAHPMVAAGFHARRWPCYTATRGAQGL